MSEVVSAWALETYSRAVGAARNGVNPQYSDERAALVIETALAAKLAEREAEVVERCAKVAEAMAAEWRKEAERHVRKNNLRSDHEQADRNRAILCDTIATAIRSTKDNT